MHLMSREGTPPQWGIQLVATNRSLNGRRLYPAIKSSSIVPQGCRIVDESSQDFRCDLRTLTPVAASQSKARLACHRRRRRMCFSLSRRRMMLSGRQEFLRCMRPESSRVQTRSRHAHLVIKRSLGRLRRPRSKNSIHDFLAPL